MSITSFLHTQHPTSTPIDDSVFDTAALHFTVETVIDAPVAAVWTAFDDDHAWKWLPGPCFGVRYPSPQRGVGVVREMGLVFAPLRFIWIEREKYWRYEPFERVSYGVVSGNSLQYLLVRDYAEDMTFTDLGNGSTKLTWTLAITPRLLVRFVSWFPALWRLGYQVIGLGPLLRRRVAEVAREQRDS